MEVISRIKAHCKNLSPNSRAAKVLRESMDSMTELEEMFATAARKAGERAKTAEKGKSEPVTRMNEENMQGSEEAETENATDTNVGRTEGEIGEKMSVDPSEYDQPITLQDVDRLREIVNSRGDISINQFTSKEIEKAQKWAYKFYRELGTKSPFFRAWFGDWRAYDQNRINIVSVPTIEISEVSLANGNYWIEDTKWDVYAGKTLNDDTRHHSGGQRINVKALTAIDAILENAVLLDTIVSKPDTKKKSDNTAFLHKLYTIIKYEGKAYIAKSTVEEFYNETTNGVSRRAYNLKAIKIEPAGGQLGNESSSSRPDTSSMEANTSVGIGESHTPIIEDTASDISIADLFAFVKKYDKDFSPKPVNKLMLTEEGTPKVFYHGTNQGDFYEFMWEKTQRADGGFYGRGHYFTSREGMATLYGNRIISAYLALKNPFVWSDEVNTWQGKKATNIASRNIVIKINLAKVFPEIFGNTTIDNWEYDEKIADYVNKPIKWSELEKIANDISKEMHIEKFSDGTYKWFAPGKYFDESFGDKYNTTKEAEANRFFVSTEILASRYAGAIGSFDDQTTYTQAFGDEITKLLKKKGYDGAMQDREGSEVVVFNSTSIKSATDNIGTFDKENPDIRYSVEDTESPDVSENSTADVEAEETFDEAEITDRDLLPAMAEQLVGDEADYKILSEYKAKHDEQKARQKRMDELADEMAETRDVMFTGAEAEARSKAAKRLSEISKELSTLSEEIASVDRELVNIEGMKVVRNLLARERLAVRDTYKNKYKANGCNGSDDVSNLGLSAGLLMYFSLRAEMKREVLRTSQKSGT